ncbi:hypothetical protein EI77_04264 [Prosthecobacter fusiformis]|uniref:Uncharacterized protein n=1 Tax=Prosthecobacter fusiformis TaxID=48464 RepID=A0A4V6Q584_9BACT|nr:hypothetical protein EI77_04264 [Prosthecobacter fusiformis]
MERGQGFKRGWHPRPPWSARVCPPWSARVSRAVLCVPRKTVLKHPQPWPYPQIRQALPIPRLRRCPPLVRPETASFADVPAFRRRRTFVRGKYGGHSCPPFVRPETAPSAEVPAFRKVKNARTRAGVPTVLGEHPRSQTFPLFDARERSFAESTMGTLARHSSAPRQPRSQTFPLFEGRRTLSRGQECPRYLGSILVRKHSRFSKAGERSVAESTVGTLARHSSAPETAPSADVPAFRKVKNARSRAGVPTILGAAPFTEVLAFRCQRSLVGRHRRRRGTGECRPT